MTWDTKLLDTPTAAEGRLEKTMRQMAATITPITKSISLRLFFIVAELMIKNRSTLILSCYILTGTVYRIYNSVLKVKYAVLQDGADRLSK